MNDYSPLNLGHLKNFSQEMIEFVPEDKNAFLRIADGSCERKLYNEPIPLLDSDLKHYKDFKKFCEDSGKEIPTSLNDASTRTWLRLLTAS